jgi:hypothetical protein
MPVDSIHFERSSYREMLIEHLFSGELMRHFWQKRGDLLEVAKPQVDDGGYDLILEANGIVRHVQLKSSHRASSLSQINIALSLGTKPDGCAIVIRFDDESLALGPFHFFGGGPGQPLPDISGLRVAQTPRRNREGQRVERPAHRCVPLRRFERIGSIGDLAARLFGASSHRIAPP